MNKPHPRQELVIHRPYGNPLLITVHTLDAREWLEAEAPQFGRLYPGIRMWDLFVDQGYDLQEVGDYLDSYNTSAAHTRP